MGHTYTTKLFIIYLKLECNWVNCVFIYYLWPAWAPRGTSFSIWNQHMGRDGADSYNLSHSLSVIPF